MQRNVRKQSSPGDSQKSGQSDAEKWFNQSNQYATAAHDSTAVDVEPPFFQKRRDSSNDDETYQDHLSAPLRRASFTPSSAGDFRSVIDDLSVEIRRLKDELNRYKLAGPGALRGDTLFEIKVHGLPKKNKRELYYTLQEFATSVGDAPESSARCKNTSKLAKECGTGWGSVSGSLESSDPPPDSAYASISNDTNTSVTSVTEAAMISRTDSSKRKVDGFLRDIPEGLYPGHTTMTDREKQILVVHRLERLYTGQTTSPSAPAFCHTNHAGAGPKLAPSGSGNEPPRTPFAHHIPSVTATERSREAIISAFDGRAGRSPKRSKAKTTGPASTLGGVQAEFGGDVNTDSSAKYTLPTNRAPPSGQRPTRIKELDPERVQIPSETMDYIRHLGLIPLELSSEDKGSTSDGYSDVGGWVPLTLLCNLAQLHLINVTPGFVRAAVTGISTKLQLSPDGRKIRWRGYKSTRPSADWVENITQSTLALDGDDVRTGRPNVELQAASSTGLSMQPGSSSGCASKTGHRIGALGIFHYKPLFFQQDSPAGQSNGNDTSSTLGFVEHRDNIANLSSCLSSATTANSRERRNSGVIIYYTRASFCTDLSGHSTDASPAKSTQPTVLDQPEGPSESTRHALLSCPPLAYEPLTDSFVRRSGLKIDVVNSDEPLAMGVADRDNADEICLDVSWSDHEQVVEIPVLEPCGLGGVTAEDHFRVVVTTRRHKYEAASGVRSPSPVDTDFGGTIQDRSSRLEIEHVSDRTEHLSPVLPPPPAHYFAPCSTDDSSDNGDDRLNVLARAQEPL